MARKSAKEINLAIKKARELLVQSKERMKRQDDKHRTDVAFTEGEKVWLSSKSFAFKYGARKLAPKWLGPFQITETIGQEWPPNFRRVENTQCLSCVAP
jgi:hypothetical protein